MQYRCSFCGIDKSTAWRCASCGMLICDSCSKGGKSGAVGLLTRAYVGVSTAGLSEVARAGYRKMRQRCLRCQGTELIRV